MIKSMIKTQQEDDGDGWSAGWRLAWALLLAGCSRGGRRRRGGGALCVCMCVCMCVSNEMHVLYYIEAFCAGGE
jgi:hypothetical protein